MSARRWPATVGRTGATLLALCALAVPARMAAQSICAAAKIELGQEAALEREGFVATLAMTNNLADQALTGLRIELVVKDASGVSSESAFFANLTSLDGTTAIDGTGTIQPSASAKARWLIVPSPGAGGTAPAGVRYTVQARMSMQTGGVPRVVTTFPVAITVKPQPLLKLEYALPFEVFGDEPMTEVRESTVPFPLGLRVSNVGAGTARSFQVQSNQPLITDNAQGLAVDFDLLGTWLGADALPENTLLIPFGDVAPGAAKQAAWSMTSSLSGRFVDFTSTFTHAAELGGALTSLIQSVTTYTLVKDVIVDLPGRDAQFDFLVNVTTPRSQLEEDLRLGREPKPEFLMESDRPGLAPVADVPGRLTGALSGAGSILRLAYDVPVGSNAWVHCAVPAPNEGAAPLVSVTRADGKVVSPRNAWISKHFDKESRRYSYFLHVLDYTGETQSDFAMAFNAANLDSAPDAVADLSAASDGAGALLLRWTATGEDGSSGTVFGGRYSIFVTTDPIVAPSAATSQVSFATSTPAGAAQSYRITGLQGNASYYVTVYLADGAGQVSAASNRASALTGAHVPGAALVSEVSAEGFTVSWDGSANRAGTEYRVLLSSAGGTISDSGYAEGRLSAVFTGLSPNASYFISASARDQSGLETPVASLATAVTRALPPGATSPAFVSVTTSSLTAVWLRAGNPDDTQFLAELSTSADHSPVFAASAWSAVESALFADLAEATTYYGRVKARDRAGVETAWLELGAERTASSDQLPPRTSLAAESPSYGADPLWIGSTTALSLSAVDDSMQPGDGLGVGVAATYLSVDGGAFSAQSGTFSVSGAGLHALRYYSVDAGGRQEAVVLSTVAVDDVAPSLTSNFVSGAVTRSTGSLVLSFSDLGVGVDTATVRLTVDAVETASVFLSSGEARYSLAGLADGPHALVAEVRDFLGRSASSLLNLTVDRQGPEVVLTPSQGAMIAGVPLPQVGGGSGVILQGVLSDTAAGIDVSTLRMRFFSAWPPAGFDPSLVTVSAPSGGGAPRPWQALGGLPSARHSHAMVAAGGFVHVMGGQVSGAQSASVLSARILGDGSLGPWQSNTPLPKALDRHGALVVEDRIYLVGGRSGSASSYNVYWTTVGTDGALAPWTAAESLPTSDAAELVGLAHVNGFIYVVGGQFGNTYSDSRTIRFAKACATGLCSGWTKSAVLWGDILGLSRATVLGTGDGAYLVTIGGEWTTSAGSYQNPTHRGYRFQLDKVTGQIVGYANAINALSLPEPLNGHVMMTQGSHIYVVGGSNVVVSGWDPLPGAPSARVYHGKVSSDGGSISWTRDDSYALPAAVHTGAGTAWNGRLYLAGGMGTGGVAQSAAYGAELDFGPPSPVTITGYQPIGSGSYTFRVEGADLAGNPVSVTSSFRLDSTPPTLKLVVDGRTVEGLAYSRSRRPLISIVATDADAGVDAAGHRLHLDGTDRSGALTSGSWTPDFDLAEGSHTVVFSSLDRVGNRSTGTASFLVDSLPPALAAISAGPFNSARPELHASMTDLGSGLEPSSLRLVVAGTTVAASVSHDGGGLGAPTAWSAATPLPQGVEQPGLAAVKGFLFSIGGRVLSGGSLVPGKLVYRAPINADGSLGAWAQLSDYPQPATGHRVVVVEDRIYVLGGRNLSGAQNWYWARVQNDGSLTAWTYFAAPQTVFEYAGAAAVGGYLYVAGGSLGCTRNNWIYAAQVCPGGLCGGWLQLSTMPQSVSRLDMASIEGDLHVFVPGGANEVCPVNAINTVYHAAVEPLTGSIGQWRQSAALPQARAAHATLTIGRNFYLVGGRTGSPQGLEVSSDVAHGRMNLDHEVLTWTSSSSYALPVPRELMEGVAWNGRLYVAGGLDAAGTPRPEVYVAQVDGGIPSSATAAHVPVLALTEGTHSLQASGQDVVGNASTFTVSFRVDLTTPVSSVAALGPSRLLAGTLYGRTTDWSLSAVDGADGSGVKQVWASVDGGAFVAVSTEALVLGQGPHDIVYYGEDLAGNVESTRSAHVMSDLLPPSAAGDLTFVDRATGALRISWTNSGDDGSVGTIISGLALIQRSTGDPVFSTSSAQVSIVLEGAQPGALSADLTDLLPGTTYSIALWTRDTAGNDSPISNVLIAQTLAISQSIDGVATLVSPLAQLHVATVTTAEQPGAYTVATTEQGLRLLTTGFYELEGGPVVFTTTATLSFVFDPAGVDLQQVAIYRWNGVYWDSAPVSSQMLTLLPGGFYEIEGRLATTSLYGVFERLDIKAPRTTLAVGEPRAEGAGRFFVTSASPLTLSSLDDLLAEGDGVGLGVAVQELSVGGNTRSFGNAAPARAAAFSSSFTVTGDDGVYPFSFFARDLFGNRETARSAEVELDDTAPTSDLAASGPLSAAASTGTFFASPSTVFDLSAADAGAGVASVEMSDNGGPFLASSASFRLTEGTHALSYRAFDRLGNLEVSRSTVVIVDARAPISTAAVGQPLFAAADGVLYGSTSTAVSVSASDPDSPAAPASGVAALKVSSDDAPAVDYAEPLRFSSGVHKVAYHSEDRVGNAETPRLLSLRVDGLAPETALAVGLPRVDREGLPPIVGPVTALSLASADPGEVASGVAAVYYRIEAGPRASYAGPFTASGPDGPKALEWSAVDNVGNAEAARAGEVAFDATAPITDLAALSGPRYSAGTSFYASSTTLFVLAAADPEVGGAASGIDRTESRVDEGSFQSSTGAFALTEGAHTLVYRSRDRVLNLEIERSTTILVDATPPTALAHVGSPLYAAPDGSRYVTPASFITFSASDPALPGDREGSGVARIEVSLDGGPFAAYSSALTLAQGVHVILYRAVDRVGNAGEVQRLSLRSDAAPPTSALLAGEPRHELATGAVLVASSTLLSLSAEDPAGAGPASGVKDTFLRVLEQSGSTAAFAPYPAPFALRGGDGERLVEFFSTDQVLNAEPVRSRAFVLDSLAPALALRAGGSGLASVVAGQVELTGEVADPHLLEYRLEAAPGLGAARGFVLVASGSSPASGVLAVWDASALSGWHTLRLSASDLVGNAASVSASVFVGEPARLLVLGDHKAFTMPEAVAAGEDGSIYAADTGADRILVFSSTGALLSSFGGHGKKGEGLSKPRGVAAGGDGSLYVADTGHGRVVKLSPSGERTLEIEGLKRPAGVALGPGGSIVVADAGRRAVKVFDSTGTLVLTIAMPPGPEEDEDDPRPWGVAVDASGRLYAADPPAGRALVFDAAGTLLRSIALPAAPGTEPRPHGVAVSADGDALFVSERQSGRVFRFDREGRLTLAFGRHGKIKDGKPLPEALVFNKPMGLWLAADGSLYVADRNNDRIQRLAAPTDADALVIPPPAGEEGEAEAAADVLDTEEGGEVARGDKAGVEVPPGALSRDTKISVAAASDVSESDRRDKAEEAGLKPVSAPVEFAPHGTLFDKPVTLTLPYSEELLQAQNASPKALAVAYWNDEAKAWEPLESEVDAHNKTVSAKTKHFSLYQVLAATGASGAVPQAAVDESFVFRDLYVYPNPARGGARPVFHLAVGVADSVRFKVFDIAGRPVHEASLSGRPGIVDDGKGPAYAYEHAWDGHIPSGVYLFVVEAERGGAAPIRKAGRFAVVR